MRPAVTFVAADLTTERVTYAELNRAAGATAAWLRRAFGVEHGDRVLLCSRNALEVVILDLALMWLGAVIVPVDPRETSANLAFIAELTGPRLAFAQESSLDLLNQAGLDPLSLAAVRTAAGGGEAAPACAALPDDPAVLLFTSGTTSEPKAVCLSHYNLTANAEALTQLHRLGPDRTTMAVLPLFHANAFGFSFAATLYAGGHLVLCDGLPLLSLRRILQSEAVHAISLAPELIRAILQRPFRQEDTPALQYVVSAAAPLSVALAREFHQRSGLRIRQGYGLSECTNFACTLPDRLSDADYELAMHEGPYTSIGPAVHACEVQILGADDRPAPEGVEGEIAVRGHNVMLGYWARPDATAAALDGGFLRTGDLGLWRAIDGRPHICVSGRTKEVIIRCGEKISPAAAEAALEVLGRRYPLVVLGFSNQHVGQEIGLYVQASDSPELRAEIMEAVAGTGVLVRPRAVVLDEAPIPRTSTGKVQRLKLAGCFAGLQDSHLGAGAPVFAPARPAAPSSPSL